MTLDELRAYLADPARDANPAVVAARALLAERDRFKAQLAQVLDRFALAADVAERLADALAVVEPLVREVERLRLELDHKTKAPWEDRDELAD